MEPMLANIGSTEALYESIAESFAEYDGEPLQSGVEEYTFFNVVIQPEDSERIRKSNNIRILDLACGDGHYTRKLKEQFPNSVVSGLDISSAMINRAQACESKLRQDIKYTCVDAKAFAHESDLPVDQQFDIVTSVYYLHHARTRDELRDMIKGISVRLKPGGTFYSLNGNVCGPLECYNNEKHKKYFFSCEITGSSLYDGMPMRFTCYSKIDGSPSFTIDGYYMSRVVYEELFRECGFSSLEWIQPRCDPNCADPSFFDDFLRFPTSIGIVARKE